MRTLLAIQAIVSLAIGCTYPAADGSATASSQGGEPSATTAQIPTTGPVSTPAPMQTPTAVPAQTPTVAPTPPNEPKPTVEPATPEPSESHVPRRIPDITIRTADTELNLRPWTWCYIPGCLDGFPRHPLPSVGEATHVEVEFPLGHWEFVAEFKEVGPRCPRTQQIELQKVGDNTWLIEPVGYAGTYDVDVFGSGGEPGAGDAVVTFRWITPTDGALPTPAAYGGVFSLTRNGIASYGASLRLIDLAAPPESVSAEMTVTADNGESLTFDFRPYKECSEDVYFDERDDIAQRAMELGPAPFTYDVVVTLEGKTYSAQAVWPRPNEELYEGTVEFEFSPPLPALGDAR